MISKHNPAKQTGFKQTGNPTKRLLWSATFWLLFFTHDKKTHKSQHNRQYLKEQYQSKIPRFLGAYTTSLQIMHNYVKNNYSTWLYNYIPPYLPIDPLPATALLLVFRDHSPTELYQSYNKIIVIIYGHIDCV